MRIDIDTIAFSAVGDGGTLAKIDLSGQEYAAIGIVWTSFTGSPTTVRGELWMADDLTPTNAFTDGDVFGTPDLTGAPVAGPKKQMISRVGASAASKTTILSEGFLLPPPLKYAIITASMSGGSSPKATGSVVIFKYTR